MKGLLSLFRSSFNELKNVRTITGAGMLMAIAIVIRSVAIEITPDIRISFSFVAIMAIAVLYGPVVAAMANVSQDFLGYIISNHTAREYSLPLAAAHIIAGIIYGIICYKALEDESEKYSITPKRTVQICISRVIVVLVCNIFINSIIIYTSYVNKDFSFFTAEGYDAFWLWLSPRIIKNVLQLIADVPIVAVMIPLVLKAYEQVRKSYSVSRKNKTAV